MSIREEVAGMVERHQDHDQPAEQINRVEPRGRRVGSGELGLEGAAGWLLDRLDGGHEVAPWLMTMTTAMGETPS